MFRLEAPDHAGLRPQASELASQLPDDLTGQAVALDCSNLVVGSPSFFDEIVKQILVERHAATLDVVHASSRAQEHLERSATNRGVRARLHGVVPLR